MKGLAILGAALLLVGCSSMATRKNADLGPRPVKVDRKDLVGYYFFDGKVLTPPGAVATVYSPYDLPISEVNSSLGKRVNRGETIITLSMPDVQAAVAQAEANERAARTSYNTAKAQYDGPVIEAQRALSEARAAEKAARTNLQNGLSADLEAATSTRQQAEEALRLAVAERDAKLIAEKEALNAAIEYLKDVRAGAKVSMIRAPISGTITAMDASPGDVAKSRKALATITDLRALRIQGLLPPEHSELVKKGTDVMITIQGAEGNPIKGTVQEVNASPATAGQAAPGYVVLIDFANADGKVRPESTIKQVGIRTGTVQNVLTVPVGAVMNMKSGKPTVKVKKGSEWVETPVEIGISDGALIEVKSGLKEGDEVLVER